MVYLQNVNDNTIDNMLQLHVKSPCYLSAEPPSEINAEMTQSKSFSLVLFGDKLAQLVK